jgi:hypothetical protein
MNIPPVHPVQFGESTMVTKLLIAALSFVLPLSLAAGCSSTADRVSSTMSAEPGEAAAGSEATVGTVVGYAPEAQSGPADITDVLVLIDGKEKQFVSLFDDATLVILSDIPCIGDQSDIVKTSSWLDPNVAIIEVSTEPGSCTEEHECAMSRGEEGKRVVALCDMSDVIRKTYCLEGDTSILLLDRDGYVQNYGSLKDYDYLRTKAEELARKAILDRERVLSGIAGSTD